MCALTQIIFKIYALEGDLQKVNENVCSLKIVQGR